MAEAKRPNSIRRAMWLLPCAYFGTLQAAESEWGVTVGVGQTDNIYRTHIIDEQSETVGSAGFDAAIYQDSKHLYANVLADLSHLNYLHDAYESEVVGNADAQIYLRVLPERFEWMFRDNFGQVRSDPFAPVTPETRENLNFFTTGPDLTAALGQRTRVRVFGRYSDVNYEKSPTDNERYGAGAALIRQLATGSYLSANFQDESVRYREPVGGNDYELQQAYLRYRLGGERTEVVVEAGYNQMEVDGQESTGGPMARLALTRELTAASSILMSGRYEITDTAVSFRTLEGTGGGGVDSSAVSPSGEAYEGIDGSIEWRFIKQRTGLHVAVAYHGENYLDESLQQDRVRTSGNAGITRRMTTRLTAEIFGEYAREKFDLTADDFTETVGRFGITWTIGRMVSTNLRYEYFTRSAETIEGEYRENRAWLEFRFGTEPVALERREVATAEAW